MTSNKAVQAFGSRSLDVNMETALRQEFTPFTLDCNGLIADLAGDPYPTQVISWDNGSQTLPEGHTYYGIVTEGELSLFTTAQEFLLKAGQFFCLPGPIGYNGYGRGLVIARLGYEGYPLFGGPLEARGRLKYIDGCSDTLLISPPILGEPCLNHLHIPPGTNQTAHTHPSQRLGVILRGSGYCLTWATPGAIPVHTPLMEGMGWWIPTGCLHSFHTADDESLDVVAWHPDSDFGPTHQAHPMINRTYVEGVSAALLPEKQTREIQA